MGIYLLSYLFVFQKVLWLFFFQQQQEMFPLLHTARHLRPGRLVNHCSKSTSSTDYCVDLVKQKDFENYLCGLLVPSDAKAAYFAVRAFNVELATVRDQTNGNAMAGRIRFQWWRDVMENIYEGNGEMASQQPVATALREHIMSKSLSRHWFDRSIDAR